MELEEATAFQGAQGLVKEEEAWEDTEAAGKAATEADQEARLAEEWVKKVKTLQARLLSQHHPQ